MSGLLKLLYHLDVMLAVSFSVLSQLRLAWIVIFSVLSVFLVKYTSIYTEHLIVQGKDEERNHK